MLWFLLAEGSMHDGSDSLNREYTMFLMAATWLSLRQLLGRAHFKPRSVAIIEPLA